MSTRGYKRFPERAAVAIGLIAALASAPNAANASGLLQGAVGPGDMSLSGASIAEPLSPSGALFANPAGLAGFPQTTVSGSLGVGFGRTQIGNDAGYDDTNEIVALIPDQAVSFARAGGLHYGVGVFGSVGMNYEFEADPDAGVDNPFFSECSIAGLPLAVAKRVRDELWIGAELVPMIGYMRNRYTTADGPQRYKLIGPGIQGMLGATWKPDSRWSLGMGLRTPGRVWLDGSSSAPSGGRQDVDLEIEMPTQLSLGLEHQIHPRLRLLSSVRWTDSSKLGDSTAGFSKLPEFRPAFVGDASDEWRGAIAARWDWTERIELRAGLGYSTRIVGSSAVSPMVFDNDHVSVTGGAAYEVGVWTLEFMAGVVPNEARNVSADEALAVPGRYETGGFVVVLGVQRRL